MLGFAPMLLVEQTECTKPKGEWNHADERTKAHAVPVVRFRGRGSGGPLSDAGRGRLLLEQALRGRKGSDLRVAEGQVRLVLADHSRRAAPVADGQGCREGRAR